MCGAARSTSGPRARPQPPASARRTISVARQQGGKGRKGPNRTEGTTPLLRTEVDFEFGELIPLSNRRGRLRCREQAEPSRAEASDASSSHPSGPLARPTRAPRDRPSALCVCARTPCRLRLGRGGGTVAHCPILIVRVLSLANRLPAQRVQSRDR
jgi:hypothetical protein